MPPPDCECIVINGKNGYGRSNSSWLLGRMFRDYETWMEESTKEKFKNVIEDKWDQMKTEARAEGQPEPGIPTQAGLCVSIYRPIPEERVGGLVYDKVYFCGFAIAIAQLAIASVPCGLFGDWGVLMITICGIVLSSVTASLPQWKREKWACRRLLKGNDKKVVLTKGNGSQHAVVILSKEGFLDLEDLASGQTNVNVSTLSTTRLIVTGLALIWIILFVSASGVKQNTWFLLAVGGIGSLQNVYVAGRSRKPRALGVPIQFVDVIGDKSVMKTLYDVEGSYPRLGLSMLGTFFPAKLNEEEDAYWKECDRTAETREAEIIAHCGMAQVATR